MLFGLDDVDDSCSAARGSPLRTLKTSSAHRMQADQRLMDRNNERAAGGDVPDDTLHTRDPHLHALDRHAEERDRLFAWALYQEAIGELESKDARGRGGRA